MSLEVAEVVEVPELVEEVEVELTASSRTENGSLGDGSPEDEGPSAANWAWSWATTAGTGKAGSICTRGLPRSAGIGPLGRADRSGRRAHSGEVIEHRDVLMLDCDEPLAAAALIQSLEDSDAPLGVQRGESLSAEAALLGDSYDRGRRHHGGEAFPALLGGEEVRSVELAVAVEGGLVALRRLSLETDSHRERPCGDADALAGLEGLDAADAKDRPEAERVTLHAAAPV